MKKCFGVIGLMIWGWGVRAQVLTLKIDVRRAAQTIENIGASGCWYSEPIGRYWPATKKKQMAKWLFSRGFDSAGDPAGIGLSAWRFNIGGGTAEQGDSSGIDKVWRRAECFLSPDGSYDWSKQAGYLWFVHQAYAYGVEKLIAFCNTPPVSMTKNGFGYKTEKDYRSNLREDRYGAYAGFLATVLDHFDSIGLPFSYISPAICSHGPDDRSA
jgi:O-glycosyl hydrolase